MKENVIFKSAEGKNEILKFYKNILSAVTYEYTEKYVGTSFGKTYLFEAGNKNKPCVFLLHGSCSNSAMWFGDIKQLAEHYHVFSIDILGEPGNSDAVRLDLSGNDHALWINEIMKNLGITSAMFIGNSLGAWISMKFAAAFPQMSEKLVLIAPSGIVNARFSYIAKSIFYALQGENGLKKLGQMISGTDELPEAVLEFNKLIMHHFNPIMGALPVLSDNELKQLTMPVLFLNGENDVINDAEKSAERLRLNAAKAELNIIKNNGHIIYNAMDMIIPFLKDE